MRLMATRLLGNGSAGGSSDGWWFCWVGVLMGEVSAGYCFCWLMRLLGNARG
jgi:hypothetical protein